jgi:hypothetical protein
MREVLEVMTSLEKHGARFDSTAAIGANSPPSNTRKSSMHQKGRGEILQGLLIGLFALAAPAHAQAPGIDFQVIHLSRHPPTSEKYTAVRTRKAWDALWPANAKDPNSPPIPIIDFKKFILLIANSGPKPSSGYSTVFSSVRDFPENMRGSASAKKMVTSVQIVEMSSGNCPVLTQLTNPVSYALIPQTANEIRFVVTKADSNCASPVTAPFNK